MNGHPATGLRTPGSLLGILMPWTQPRSGEIRLSANHLPFENGRLKAHSYGSVLVLVVDDNPVNLMVISALMEARGLVPFLAADGAEAVALACELHFDLILMDLQMPILDGLEATAAIRQFETAEGRPAVPVLAYSSTTPGTSVLASHGFSGSLKKPCEDRNLEDCLVQWCPTYRPVPVEPGIGLANGGWQIASSNVGPQAPLGADFEFYPDRPSRGDAASGAPDSGGKPTRADIAPEDWDLLFRAALELLERVATEKPARGGSRVPLQPPGTALRECLHALDQLRRSVPIAHQQPMHQRSAREGELQPPAPAPASSLGR